jgi:ATP-binding cassette subfamily B protein
MNADQIVVLEKGKVAAKGKHSDLYQTCDLYRKLVDMQNEATNWKFSK